jgi:predicted metal-dependent phosphoesterase TrpH
MSLNRGPTFDLQSHSLHSDGALAPAQVVAAAAAAGVELLALSDHDTTAGIAEAQAAARAVGIHLVTATEITAVHDGRLDLHILGYRIDPRHPGLQAALVYSRGDRERRADAMAARLRELGFAFDETGLALRAAEGKPIGRPHLAAAVVAHPDNHARLQQAGLNDMTAFLVAYLIEGAPAFVARSAPTVDEAIALIHEAGGVAVWAHPFWDLAEDAQVLDALAGFRAAGLDGVEAFYATHTAEQTRLLVQRAADDGLYTTGSADFHGPEHRLFSRFRAFELHGLAPNLGPIAPSIAG